MTTAIAQAKSIRLFILDVDGVLTDGTIYYTADGSEIKGFHIHDGLGLQLLKKSGIDIAIISGKHSVAVEKRLQDLNITHYYLGVTDKIPPYEALKKQFQLNDEAIAYMGDDLPDLPLLKRAGFAITVPDAPAIVQQQVDLITKKSGGAGAVREVCELILQAQQQEQTVLQSYLL